MLLGPPGAGCTVADAYAACDVVVLPSTWEGFGNPSVESAPIVARWPSAAIPWRPSWPHSASDGSTPPIARLAAWLGDPDPGLVEHNHQVAATYFSQADLPVACPGPDPVPGTPHLPMTLR